MNNWMRLLERGGFGYMDENDGDGNDLGGAGGEGDDKGADDKGDDKGADDKGDDKGADDKGDDKGADDKGDDKGAGKDYHVPKSRMDAVTQRANRERDRADNAEAELAALKSGGDAADKGNAETLESKLKTLDDKMDAAIADNDAATVRSTRNEIREVERQINQEYVNQQTSSSASHAQDVATAGRLLSDYEKEYPIIDPDSPAYDDKKDTEVAAMKKAFEAAGNKPAEALAKAVSYVLGVTPEKDGAEQRGTDVDKNLDTHGKQPGKMGGKDNGDNGMSKGINPMQLSDDEFEKLTEEQVSHLRGDTYTG